MNRRRFMKHASWVAADTLVSSTIGSESLSRPKAFFTLRKQKNRWWLITPTGQPFFSIGLNHIDAASLRYVENQHIWHDQYGNSMQKWLQQVRGDLQDWGFNTVGWVQEVVTREPENHRHSRNFTYEEYQWLDMPYCHMLPFVDVLSFQCFGKADGVQEKLGYWAQHYDTPLLLADNSNGRKGAPHQHGSLQDPIAYGEIMKVLRTLPTCIGYHLCGAYVQNRVRRRGLRDSQNAVDLEGTDGIRKVNQETTRWAESISK